MTARFLDLSNHNAYAHMAEVKADGYAGVYLKATEWFKGRVWVDPTFAPRKAEAKAAGLLVGGYCFFHPAAPIEQQIDGFLHVVGDDMDLRHALDHETSDNLSPARVAAAAVQACSLLRAKAGHVPVLYTYRAFAWSGCCAGLADEPLWLADYSGSAHVPGPWTAYAGWQTGQEQVPGVAGGDGPGVDVDQAPDIGPLLIPNHTEADMPLNQTDLDAIVKAVTPMFDALREEVDNQIAAAIKQDNDSNAKQTFRAAQQLAQITGQLAGLSTAVSQIAKGGPVDLSGVTAAAEAGVQAAFVKLGEAAAA